ncbi:RsmE family RNA methyltransferase [Pelovirga terrestris]|uniref:Ribosomal RNA small subunit methyltransferase E n=1 Tax=Pelovirga terrestris TaxID=2771352 RepID=A0A8J6QUP0_9BACT|nr:RsmE family RNA methyltransferase [Pelovirga terrestris]MBD1400535.1 16S rRNA (uracil(1498)-N(3))-methyltransferase [Pelovirga terrestris]
MRRFLVTDVDFRLNESVLLPEGVQHHLLRVLRLEPGATFRLFDGSGQVADAVLQDGGRACLCRLHDSLPAPCQISLIQGVPKGDKTELILQKGTELGVSQFHLVTTARSVVRFKNRSHQSLRWQKIIEEAARQSGQYHLPRLQCSNSLKDVLGDDPADLKLLLWEKCETPLADVLGDQRYQRISVMVGPEGGITEAEAAEAVSHGYQAASLGPRILRTETAGLAIIAVLQYLYGDLSGNTGSI